MILSFKQDYDLEDMMTDKKYYLQVACPPDPNKKQEPSFHNFTEWLNEEIGQLKCCDEPGKFLIFDTYKEAEQQARKIAKFFYIVEVKEYVT
jgi:hypothetical protein